MTRRFVALVLMVGGLLIALANPAMADPAEPGNYRSRVTDVDPRIDGLAVGVAGGDAFVVVAVDPGHVLEVPGYFGEPYVRIDADGTVWRNELSPARFINTDRYGTTIPDTADHSAAPEWRRVGGDGSYAWHDHRTHWMSVDRPPTIGGDRAQLIFPWDVPMFYDGVEVRIHGELVWFPNVNPAGPLVLGVFGVLPLILWNRSRTWLLPLWVSSLGAVALFVATVQFAATPVDRGLPVPLALPLFAVVTGSILLRSTGHRAAAVRLAASIGIGIWVWARIGVLSAPVLPSALPPTVERSLIGIVLISAVAASALAIYELVVALRRLGFETDLIQEGAQHP